MTTASSNTGHAMTCSFCGKTHEQVAVLIKGRGGAFICDECVQLCNEICLEEMRGRLTAKPKPKP